MAHGMLKKDVILDRIRSEYKSVKMMADRDMGPPAPKPWTALPMRRALGEYANAQRTVPAINTERDVR
jgi:hypothetical protein